MSDEIRNQNVARLTFEGDHWRAAIGPEDGRGLEAKASHPARALRSLAALIETKGWAFDPSYRPRPEPQYHEV